MPIEISSANSHVICNVPVSRKANGDRNQFEAWRSSDPKADYIFLVNVPIHLTPVVDRKLLSSVHTSYMSVRV